MSGMITPLKRHWVFPILGLLVSVFLLSGQLLNCCFTNEVLASSLARLFSATSNLHFDEIGGEDFDSSIHEDCHSHRINKDNNTPPKREFISNQNGIVELATYTAPDHCLFEKGLAALPMIKSDLGQTSISGSVAEVYQERLAQLTFHHEKPIPQKKSGPPLYLTLRHFLI